VSDSDKRSSLLRYGFNYGPKSFRVEARWRNSIPKKP